MILLALLGLLAAHCSAAGTISWADLVKGARLPHGSNVIITGELSDLRCGTTPVSDVLEVTGVSIAYAGRSSAAAISGSSWTVTLGRLPANTAVNLQLKIAGTPIRQGQGVPPPCVAISRFSAESFAAGVPQITPGIQLPQTAFTQDLTKYAALDAGVLQTPHFNDLRQFYLVHAYPWGPVGLETSGHVPFAQRWSLAIGASPGTAGSGREVVYGLGFRVNKYFHFTAGVMIRRDAASGRLSGSFCFGPSIDITAMPGLTSIFGSQ